MIFAVLDPSPLTVCINCSFLHLSQYSTGSCRSRPGRATNDRPSDAWFDGDCHEEQRRYRRLARRKHRSAEHLTAQSTQYRRITRRKRETYWKTVISEQRSTPRRLWQSIDSLLDRGRVLAGAHFYAFFDKKVSDIQKSTAGAP